MKDRKAQGVEDMIKVTAAVIEENGRILIAQRGEGGPFGNKWEFPGGKVEPRETPEQCLERELYEELGIQARAGEFLGSSRYDYGHIAVELLAFRVKEFSGEIRLTEHQQSRWVLPHELEDYDFPEADRPILRLLLKRG